MRLCWEMLPDTVAVVGNRDFPRLDVVRVFVQRLKPGTLVVSGGARGVDATAEATARSRADLPEPLICKPDKYLRQLTFREALLRRNTDIVVETVRRRGLLVAFVMVPTKTGGTLDTLRKSDPYSLPVMKIQLDANGSWSVVWNGAAMRDARFRSWFNGKD